MNMDTDDPTATKARSTHRENLSQARNNPPAVQQINADTINRADQNFIETWALIVGMSAKGEVLRNAGVVVTNSNLRIPTFNRIFLEPSQQPSFDIIKQAIDYFENRALPFELCIKNDKMHNLNGWTEAGFTTEDLNHLVSKHNLQQQPYSPGMMLPNAVKQDVTTTQTRNNIRSAQDVVHVKNLAMLNDFKKVSTSAYDIPPHITDKLLTPAILEQPNITLFLRYAGNTPVAASMLVITEDIGGIYWVGTDQSYRQQGHAKAVTWRAIGDAWETGCQLSSLQASEMGEPIYRKMGFTAPMQYNLWLSEM